MTLVATRTVTDAVETKLTSAAPPTPVVGDGEAPTGDPPYVVLYPISGGATSGTLGDRHGDAVNIIQLSCVGTSREQAEWLQDRCLGLLLGVNTLTIAGRNTLHVDLDFFGGILRDDDKAPPLYTATPRIRIYTTTT